MSGLLRESYPHLVLLSTLRRQQGKDGHHDEDHHDAQLPVGILGETFQQRRLVIAHQQIVASSQIDGNRIACLPHASGVVSHVSILIDVTILHHSPLGICDDDGDSGVALDESQRQREVGLAVSLLHEVHRLRPEVHLRPFLLLEVAHQLMADEQRGSSNENGSHHKHDLHLAYSVNPLHSQ